MTERLLADAWPDNTVWLASYPRSGNSYLRAILWNCFGLRSGSLYADDLQGDVNVARQIGHYEAAAHGVFSAPFRRLPLVKTHEWPVVAAKRSMSCVMVARAVAAIGISCAPRATTSNSPTSLPAGIVSGRGVGMSWPGTR